MNSPRTFRSALAAKFWREEQARPTDWVISLGGSRDEFVVSNISVLRKGSSAKLKGCGYALLAGALIHLSTPGALALWLG